MEEKIKYWIYQFEMPEEGKKFFDRALEMLGMTPNEFIKAAVEYAMEHPAVDPDPIIDIKQVRCYPVYEGETDEEALERQLEKERLEDESERDEKRDE